MPLAVDMITTFTARRRALMTTMEQDSMADFAVYNQMRAQDIDKIVARCMDRWAVTRHFPCQPHASYARQDATLSHFLDFVELF